MRGDLVDSRNDKRKIRIFGLSQRGRHADVDRVDVGECCEVGRGSQRTGIDDGLQVVGCNVGNVRFATVDAVDLGAVDIEPDGADARFRELDDEREPDIPKPDHADTRAF